MPDLAIPCAWPLRPLRLADTKPIMIHIGIDPGARGGIAALWPDGRAAAWPMPRSDEGYTDPAGVASILSALHLDGSVGIAIERVGAMPKQGVASTFKFGTAYGMLIGVVAAMALPMRLVTPQSWKRLVLAESYAHDKEGMIRYCQATWPHLNLVLPRCRTPHDGMADALGIAEWARQSQSGPT